MARLRLVAVRRGTGPVHLAHAVAERRLVAVCGGRFGLASVVKVAEWRSRRTPHCPDCLEAASHARTERQLAAIAGW